MIDRAALEELAAQLLEEINVRSNSGASLLLQLFNGEQYAITSPPEFHDHYMVVSVYPKEPLSAEDLKKVIPHDTKGLAIFDKIILPYQAVSYVTITAREPERRSTIGFAS